MAKKATSIKKVVKSSKSKSSIKKFDFKKNWKKLSYLGLAGFLIVSSTGYGLWRIISPNTASAANLIYKSNGICVETYSNYRALIPANTYSAQFSVLSQGYWRPVGPATTGNPIRAGQDVLVWKNSIANYVPGSQYAALKFTITSKYGSQQIDTCYAKLY